MDAGGLDREAAEGEAAGAASSPTQKISYITGKWQIMNLLGRYKDKKGENFRLGQFHDDLIKNLQPPDFRGGMDSARRFVLASASAEVNFSPRLLASVGPLALIHER